MTDFTTIDAVLAKSKLPILDPKTHKGNQGHAVIIGGSRGKIGAVCLASLAALRSGCGLVTAYIPKCGYGILQTAVPEAMVITDNNEDFLTRIDLTVLPQSIGIGPGMGQDIQTQKAFHQFLANNKVPLIIDADALNILSLNNAWLDLIPESSVLTPHPKELERLIGAFSSEEQKLGSVMEFAKMYNLIVVVKGSPTIICDGEVFYENSSGNAALATAGSGDVLTGIVTGLRAQGLSAIDAAIVGVYLHGQTSNIAMAKMSPRSFIASDIISNLGAAFRSIDR